MTGGMTRIEVDRAESKDLALHGKPMRPRAAATLVLLDKTPAGPTVLMGRRHLGHAFMPGKFVFPGGRTDPADGRIPVVHPLHPDEASRLTDAGNSPKRGRAIALSAVRETYEEVGLLLGHKGVFETDSEAWRGFVQHQVRPSLESLRLIARAITPPGRVRRYDTWFFSAWRSDIAVALEQGGPTEELEELVWVPLVKAREMDVPMITRSVLNDLERRLERDPLLRPGGEVPFYRMVRNKMVRDII